MKTTIKTDKEVEIKKVLVNAGVRYWEDCKLNGKNLEEDSDFSKIPCKENDKWCPIIDVDNGIILNWTKGTKLKTHFKVCDECSFSLVDAEGNTVYSRGEYVPDFLDIDDNGFGDYIYLTIDEDGKILNWKKEMIQEFLESLED